MIRLTCAECRLVWLEDRSRGDSPIHQHAFCCPRCDQVSTKIIPLPDKSRQRLWVTRAPTGTWSTGPNVVYAFADSDTVLQEYRDMGWAVEGPYVLEESLPAEEARAVLP